MKSWFLATAIMTGMAMNAGPALAHDDAKSTAQKAAHGGQLRQAGGYFYELVVAREATTAKDSPVIVHVTDAGGKKVSTAGASGTATLLTGKLKASVALKPDGDNRLKGLARYAASPDMKVVAAVTLAGRQPEQARFTPLSPAQDGNADHKH